MAIPEHDDHDSSGHGRQASASGGSRGRESSQVDLLQLPPPPPSSTHFRSFGRSAGHPASSLTGGQRRGASEISIEEESCERNALQSPDTIGAGVF